MTTKTRSPKSLKINNKDYNMSEFWAKKTLVTDFEVPQKKKGRRLKSEKVLETKEVFTISKSYVPENLPVFEIENKSEMYNSNFDDFTMVVDNTDFKKPQKKTRVAKVQKDARDEEVILGKMIKSKYSKVRSVKKTGKKGDLGVISRLMSKVRFPSLHVKRINFNSFINDRRYLTLGISILFVGLLSFTSYAAYSSITLSNQDIIKKAGEHVMLPTSETPKVYAIKSENSEIFSNPLFSGIKVGDNVLNYEASGKVVIYRSSEDKVVNIINTK